MLLKILSLLVVASALLVIYRLFHFVNVEGTLRGIPGFRLLLPLDGVSLLLPPIPFISLGNNHLWKNGYKWYQEFGWETYKVTTFWPVTTWLFTVDTELIKEITISRNRFPKAVAIYRMLGFYGKNISVANNSEWPIHRKISNPAFSEENMRLVWAESQRLLDELFETWGSNHVIKVSNVPELTSQFSLSVISGAGFGRHISWKDLASDEPDGLSGWSFPQALAIVDRELLLRISLPEFVWGSAADRNAHRISGLAGRGWLGKRVQRVSVAYSTLRAYMIEMIETKKAHIRDEDHCDLFTNLIRASEAEKEPGERGLTEDELLGNIFGYLLSGKDSSGHTLVFALGLLALYPDKQENAYHACKSVIPNSRPPCYDDHLSLTYISAVFLETLRLYPAASSVVRQVVCDTAIKFSSCPSGKDMKEKATATMAVPSGTYICLNFTGLHRNPHYWEDPWAFKPERFMKDWPKDAFMPFSNGPRACIGRKFSETESVAFLTRVLLRYKVCIDDERFPDIPGESPELRRDRLLPCTSVLTLTPTSLALKFVKRQA